jgi:hypothetical protein
MVRIASLVTRVLPEGRRSEVGLAPRSPVSFGFADILAPMAGPSKRADLTGTTLRYPAELAQPTRAIRRLTPRRGQGSTIVPLGEACRGTFLSRAWDDCKRRAPAIFDGLCRQFWRLNQKIQPCSPLCAIQAGSSPLLSVSRCHRIVPRAPDRHSKANYVGKWSIWGYVLACRSHISISLRKTPGMVGAPSRRSERRELDGWHGDGPAWSR